MASQPRILNSMPETNVSVPRDGGGVEDGTFMLPLPTSALSRRNILYLPSKMSDHRESIDQCASSGNRARQ